MANRLMKVEPQMLVTIMRQQAEEILFKPSSSSVSGASFVEVLKSVCAYVCTSVCLCVCVCPQQSTDLLLHSTPSSRHCSYILM